LRELGLLGGEWVFVERFMRHIAKFAVAVAAVASLSVRAADLIPYGNVFTENPTTYTFTALSTEHVIAYFWDRSGAAFENVLGLKVNGVLQGGFGLDNQTSNAGDHYDFGSVNAGDTLVFVMRNLHTDFNDQTSPSLGDVFSDKSQNGPYDGFGPGPGLNHIYSTPYTGNPDHDNGIPHGIYVGFEDLPAFDSPDFNYTDEQFVFTNVASSAAPLPSTALFGSVLLGGLWVRRRVRRAAA
jgi:hypothetical protein